MRVTVVDVHVYGRARRAHKCAAWLGSPPELGWPAGKGVRSQAVQPHLRRRHLHRRPGRQRRDLGSLSEEELTGTPPTLGKQLCAAGTARARSSVASGPDPSPSPSLPLFCGCRLLSPLSLQSLASLLLERALVQ